MSSAEVPSRRREPSFVTLDAFVQDDLREDDQTRSRHSGGSVQDLAANAVQFNQCWYNDNRRSLKVEKTLGSGAFGTVVKVRNVKTDDVFAVKVIRDGGGDNQQLFRELVCLDRIRRNAKTHGLLLMRFVVPTADSFVAIFTEYENGPCLADALRGERHLFAGKTRSYVAQLCRALSHLAEREIVHRDVKPGNIILSNERGPVLVDFGLAVSSGGGSRAGGHAGTYGYMSPSALLGRELSPLYDVFSLGVVAAMLYDENLCRSPFALMRDYREKYRLPRNLCAVVNVLVKSGRSASHFEAHVPRKYRARFKAVVAKLLSARDDEGREGVLIHTFQGLPVGRRGKAVRSMLECVEAERPAATELLRDL